MDPKRIANKLGASRLYPGSNLVKGTAYHDIPIPPFNNINSHRKGTLARANHIMQHFDCSGLTGLDIGCSVGGISFSLSRFGSAEKMVGVDYDEGAIEVAQNVAKASFEPCEFFVTDIGTQGFWNIVQQFEFDFAVWLSSWMWVNKSLGRQTALEVLRQISEVVPTLIFDCAQGPKDGMAGEYSLGMGAKETKEQLDENTFYTNVTDIGLTPTIGWHKRNVFLCTN